MDKKRVQQLKRNVFLYYFYTVFGKTGFWVPVLYFFLTDVKEFSSVTALLLISATALSTSIFEIPTGVIADKVSRKVSMTIGASIRAICMFLLLPLGGFVPILIVMIGRGIGTSFTSGAEDSLLYDTMQELEDKQNYKKQLNKIKTYHFLQVGLTTLFAGYMASISLNIPIVMSGVSYFFASLVAYFLVEPKKESLGAEETHESYLRHAKSSLVLIFSSKGIRMGIAFLILATALMEAILVSNKQIVAPILDSMGVKVELVGFALSIIFFTKALGSFAASKLNKNGNEYKEIFAAMLFYCANLIVLAVFNNPIIATITLAFIIGIDPFIMSNLLKLINDRIPSSKRATVISMQSLMMEVIETGYLPLFGFILAEVGLFMSMNYILGTVGVVLLFLVLNIRFSRNPIVARDSLK